MQKKVRSFTIMELVVALIISSIVTSMAYYALHLFTKRFGQYQIKAGRLNDFFLFEKAWLHDWDQALYIREADAKSITMEYPDKTTVYYVMKDKWLIRMRGVEQDTLPVSINNENHHLFDDKRRLIDRVRLNISIDEETIECVYEKQYAAKELLQLSAQ